MDAVVVAKMEVPVTTEIPVVVAFVTLAFVITAFVVVELPTMRLVRLVSVAARLVKNPFVEVALVIALLVP